VPGTGRPGFYPVSLDVAGRRCLVVGGGETAGRKAAGLARCGATVTVVAPELHPSTEELSVDPAVTAPGRVVFERRDYAGGEAAGYRLVVTATGIPTVDGAVATDAEAAGVWVNSADDPANCTFHLPSVHRDGAVSVAVSTGGTSPAMATWLRKRLAEAAGPGLGTLAGLLEAARRRLQSDGLPTDSVDWHALLDGPLPDLVRRGDVDGARTLVNGAIPPPDGSTAIG
jgi:siroheme synthase-like protein